MLKLVAVLIGIILLGYALMTVMSGSGAFLGDPVTSSANLDLKVKAQAGMAVEVAGASNRIRQVMAAGNDPAQRQPLLDDLARLHRSIDEARIRLTDLGDPQAAIDHWLGIIRWNEFLALEQEFLTASKHQ